VEQTRRHAAVLALLRVPRLVLAINKIDLVGYDEETLTTITKDFAALARSLGFPDEAVVTIPVSALQGDNVVERSERTPWYDGPTLLGHLESVPVDGPEADAPFRLPVQYVIRPRTDELHDYRGYAGQVASGTVQPGDEVVVLPAGLRTRVASVDTADGRLEAASAGRSVTVLLADDIDVSRGDLIAAADAAPVVTDELDATLCWLADKPLRPGARLLLKHGTRTTQVIVGAVSELLDTDTLTFGEAPAQLSSNDIAHVSLRLGGEIAADAYEQCHATGAFILIDEATNDTVAAGMITPAE
jgi:sulfate adenylyltransferase subunit 1